MDERRGKGKGFSRIRKFDFNGKLLDFSAPRVMGIVNLTPDSFYAGSRYFESEEEKRRQGDKGTGGAGDLVTWRDGAEKMVTDGAYIIDIGAVSTRPGAKEVTEDEEKTRLVPVLKAIRSSYPEIFISVDTYRAEIARMAVDEGADIINDISGGTFDPAMIPFIAAKGVPYIVMHIRGNPSNMQNDPKYDRVVEEVYAFLERKCNQLRDLGHEKIITDPGFGFGKTVEHNYALLKELGRFNDLGFPVLAGLSRKSMINKVLLTKPENALNGTTVLNTIALMNGASILRVHDVKEAAETVKLVQLANKQ